jgi:NTP pyrophosphatase (non-canonical NTP hydrolase)
MNFEELQERVVAWAAARRIIPNSTPTAQALKTAEEAVELLQALHKKDDKETIDAYADILITLIIGCRLSGYDLVSCLEAGYDVIKNRTGYLGSDGIFYKSDGHLEMELNHGTTKDRQDG